MRRDAVVFSRLMLIFLATLPGCGSESEGPKLPETIPFSGTVKLDGKPMAGGTIMFTSVSPNAPYVSGQIAGDGKYLMKTSVGRQEKDGVVPGKYKVSISRFLMADGTPQDPTVPAAVPGVESLPARYSNPSMTQLEVTVSQGLSTMDFEIRSR
jgi:hypothetical protein